MKAKFSISIIFLLAFVVLAGAVDKKTIEKRVAHKMTMTNLADRTETVNLLDKVQFGGELPDSIFESRNLEK